MQNGPGGSGARISPWASSEPEIVDDGRQQHEARLERGAYTRLINEDNVVDI